MGRKLRGSKDERACSGPVRSPVGLAGHFVALWSVLFICLLVVPDFMFQLESFRKIMTTAEMAGELSAMIVVWAMVSFLLAAAIAVTAYAAGAIFGGRAYALAEYLGNAAVLSVAAFFFLSYVIVWVKDFFGGNVSFSSGPFVKYSVAVPLAFAVLAFAAAVRFRKGLSIILRDRSGGMLKVFGVIFCIAAVMVGLRAFNLLPAGTGHPLAAAGNRRPATKLPNVILVTFDALTARDMSLYGYPLKTTPSMDSLAASSYVFDNMFANYNATRPSAVSIMTGLYPFTHKMTNVELDIFGPTPSRRQDFLGMLRKAGYQTATVNSNFIRAHPYVTDLWESFDHQPLVMHGPVSASRTWLKRNIFLRLRLRTHLWLKQIKENVFPGWLVSDVIGVMGSLGGRDRKERAFQRFRFPPRQSFAAAARYLDRAREPFMLWVHVLPPHDPYLPGRGYRYAFLRDERWTRAEDFKFFWSKRSPYLEQSLLDAIRLRYDEHVRYCDAAFGEFLEYLKKGRLLDDAVLIVSADHGEIFERGMIGHCRHALYQPLIHIPLIVHLPGQKAGRRIASNAELVDLAPTILDLAGIPIPDWMEGESLKGALNGKTLSMKPKFSVYFEENGKFGGLRQGVLAVVKGKHKFIYDVRKGKGELYNLADDPGERTDLSGVEPVVAESLERLLRERVIDRF